MVLAPGPRPVRFNEAATVKSRKVTPFVLVSVDAVGFNEAATVKSRKE